MPERAFGALLGLCPPWRFERDRPLAPPFWVACWVRRKGVGVRFVHTSDLHLGRRLAQMPLDEDMEHVLGQLERLCERESADALVVAGDVYDSTSPTEAAVRQWDRFITRMADAGIALLVVSGNHDSGPRLGVGSELIARTGVHIAGELDGEVDHVRVGGTTFWLVPFVRPAEVRAWGAGLGLDVASVVNYDTALRLVLDHVRSLSCFREGPNVCVAHQFVTNHGVAPERSDSEHVSLGSLDNVDVSAFEGFDYVALGHIHRPQRVGRDTVRYSGSPLKLSSSEIPQRKSFCVIDVDQSGSVSGHLEPVEPLHDFRSQRGSVDELVECAKAEDEREREDYIHAIVTDDSALDVVMRLRHVWPNLEQVVFDNSITRAAGASQLPSEAITGRSMEELFGQFFEEQAGRPLSETERGIARDSLEGAAADERSAR